MTLGLKRHTVKLVPYTNDWALEYDRCFNVLSTLLEQIQLTIEHIGSTSIPGTLSKPILDIAIGVHSNEDKLRAIAILSANGYIDRGDRFDRGGYLMVVDAEPDIVSHHIHILGLKDIQWSRYLKFRDCLRANASLRQEYEKIKEDLLERHHGNRVKYTNGKDIFISKIFDSIS